MHTSLRSALLPLAVGGLLLSACTADEPTPPIVDQSEDETILEDEDPLAGDDRSTPDEGDGTPTPSERPPVTPSIAVPSLDAQCFVEPSAPRVDQVTFSVPSDWQVDGSCEFLDPAAEEVEADTEPDVAIVVSTSEGRYSEVVEPGPTLRDVKTWRGARAGYQTTRRSGTSTGAGLQPEGAPVLSWLHDLDDSTTDEDGGLLTISTSSDDQQVRAVADAIAQTVVITPPAGVQAENNAPESLAVVRVDDGDTPYAVTFDGDCFALRDGGPDAGTDDQECSLDATTGPLVARVLGDDVVVGYAPGVSIGVEAEGVAPPYGLTLDVEGGSVFAFRAQEVPSSLTAIGPGGEELVTVDVG